MPQGQISSTGTIAGSVILVVAVGVYTLIFKLYRFMATRVISSILIPLFCSIYTFEYILNVYHSIFIALVSTLIYLELGYEAFLSFTPILPLSLCIDIVGNFYVFVRAGIYIGRNKETMGFLHTYLYYATLWILFRAGKMVSKYRAITKNYSLASNYYNLFKVNSDILNMLPIGVLVISKKFDRVHHVSKELKRIFKVDEENLE